MTRQECEQRLIQLAEQANAVYQEFNPTGNALLSITCIDGQISVIDTLKDADGNFIEAANGKGYARYINCTKFADGDIWGTEKWEAVLNYRANQEG